MIKRILLWMVNVFEPAPPPIEKPVKRPRLYKQATVVTKGELPKARKAPVRTAVKKPVAKKTTTKGKK